MTDRNVVVVEGVGGFLFLLVGVVDGLSMQSLVVLSPGHWSVLDSSVKHEKGRE